MSMGEGGGVPSKATIPLGVIPGAAMIPTSSRTAVAGRLAERFVGWAIPSLVLSSREEFPVNLRDFASGFGFVLYVYPGMSSAPQDGQDTAGMDAIQHRAFRDRQPELEAAGYRVIAISSQPEQAQRRAVAESRLTHRLLSDPKLALARELKLPTFPIDGARWYRRLILVASEGRIEKVFFPVSSPARSADQVIAWMKIQGIS
jgi:peroxiredoxin